MRGPLFLDGQGGAQRTRPARRGALHPEARHPAGRRGAGFLPALPARGRGCRGRRRGGGDRRHLWARRSGRRGGGAREGRGAARAGSLRRRAGPSRAGPGGRSRLRRARGEPAGSPAARLPGRRFRSCSRRTCRRRSWRRASTRPFTGFELDGGRLRLGTGVRSLVLAPGSMEVELVAESFGGERWRIELEYDLGAPRGLGRPAPAGGRLGTRPQGARAADGRRGGPPRGYSSRTRCRARSGCSCTLPRSASPPRAWPCARWAAASRRCAAWRWCPAPGARARGRRPGPALDPLPADPATVLHYDPRLWRRPDYELFAWERFPGILILDTADYAVQDRFFKRLAFFVEKQGYRGRLVSRAGGERAARVQRPRLPGRGPGPLLRGGRCPGLRLEPGGGAAARHPDRQRPAARRRQRAADGRARCCRSRSESSDLLRAHLLTHEAFHGLFFTLPRYREACEAAWRELEEPERRFWRLFLDWGGYDFHDGFLAANEMQAYLFQQPRAGLNFYFRRLSAGAPGARLPREASWLARLPGRPAGAGSSRPSTGWPRRCAARRAWRAAGWWSGGRSATE